MLGVAFTGIMSWTAIEGKYLDIPRGRNNQHEPDPEESCQVSSAIVDVNNDKENNASITDSICEADQNQSFSKSSTQIAESIKNDNDGFTVVESPTETVTGIPRTSTFNVRKDMLHESLIGISQKIEEMETQITKATEKNKEQCKQTEKHMKEMKETIKLQHRETRRRLERLEKKTNSGYFI